VYTVRHMRIAAQSRSLPLRHHLPRLAALVCCLALFSLTQALRAQTKPASQLIIYAIDVEGGQSTLLVDTATHASLLVDTGSSGLVIPYTDLGSGDLQALVNLLELGLPTGIGESGYSGGVDYLYLTYDTTVDYPTTTGTLDTSNIPIDVEILSWPTSFSSGSPLDFQQFLSDDDVSGILGVGPTGTGPGTSPFESAGFDGVTVDLDPNSAHYDELVVGSNAGTPLVGGTVDGAPTSDLYESINNGIPVQVSDDVDSGGVYGTIPSSLESGGSVPNGTLISVYDNSTGSGTPLYSYTTGTGTGDYPAPTVVSGTDIDSGVVPYLEEPIFIDYSGDGGAGTLTFDQP